MWSSAFPFQVIISCWFKWPPVSSQNRPSAASLLPALAEAQENFSMIVSLECSPQCCRTRVQRSCNGYEGYYVFKSLWREKKILPPQTVLEGPWLNPIILHFPNTFLSCAGLCEWISSWQMFFENAAVQGNMQPGHAGTFGQNIHARYSQILQ